MCLIDIYSKVIVGHQVSNHMRKGANLKALKGAINKFGAPQIHHSDRGSQYGSQAYIDLLAKHQVQISMAKSGPQNAYAERINLTIKDEFLNHWQIPDLIMLKRLTRKAVNYYNYKRKHNHLGRLTPIAFLKAYPALAVNDRPIVNIPILNS
jgi:putative transposase